MTDKIKIVDQIVMMNIDEVLQYENNPRIHSDQQIEQLAEVIKEVGFNSPVLIDGNKTLIAGHGRWMAAKRLGMTEIPTLDGSHMNEAQRKAFVIADNRLSELSTWDRDKLRLEVGELEAFNMQSLTAFAPNELAVLMGRQEKSRNTNTGEGEFLVVVTCKSESEQGALFDEFTDRGLDVKIV